jgi:prephenate dehydratase
MAVPVVDIPTSVSRVAFQGEHGAFGEDAVAALWADATPTPQRSLTDVLRSVATGEVDAGVLPVENTVAGGVVAAYDALAAAPDVHVVAETILAIEQCLLALPGATLEELSLVASHPVALMQCGEFLSRFPALRQQASSNTATAAHDVAASGDRSRAAIAGKRAARRYGLAVLVEHIEDRPDNQTRFLAVAREPAAVVPGVPARTSLVFTTANRPGALLHALEPIADNQLNLSKLESRPTGEPWTYQFFADIDHDAGDPRLEVTVSRMRTATQHCRIFGTYRRALP